MSASPRTLWRLSTGLPSLDYVLGGGLVMASAILLAAPTDIGRTFLTLQMLDNLGHRCLYVMGEETREQVAAIARHAGITSNRICVSAERSLEKILADAREMRVQGIAVDSFQKIISDDAKGAIGSVAQLRESARRLIHYARTTGTTLWLIGDVTDDGDITWPQTIEHDVDVVLELDQGPRFWGKERILHCSDKNRFGPANVTGCFELTASGFISVNAEPMARKPLDKYPSVLTDVNVPLGTLRVWWIPQVPGKPLHVPVADIAQAKLVLETLARYALFQLRERIKPDCANAGGLEVFDGDGWFEWDDENGNSIDDLMRQEQKDEGHGLRTVWEWFVDCTLEDVDRAMRDIESLQRGAMFWMLREAGASYVEIAKAAGLSRWRVEVICMDYGRELQHRCDQTVSVINAPFMQRLHAAGALSRRKIDEPCFSIRGAEDPTASHAVPQLELWTRLTPLGKVERSRVMNALANAKIFTTAQLWETSAEDLARIKNLGTTSRAKLAVLGLLGDAARQAAEASGPYRRSRAVKLIREIVSPDLAPGRPAVQLSNSGGSRLDDQPNVAMTKQPRAYETTQNQDALPVFRCGCGCGREQLARSEQTPSGLSVDEAIQVGWRFNVNPSRVRSPLCP